MRTLIPLKRCATTLLLCLFAGPLQAATNLEALPEDLPVRFIPVGFPRDVDLVPAYLDEHGGGRWQPPVPGALAQETARFCLPNFGRTHTATAIERRAFVHSEDDRRVLAFHLEHDGVSRSRAVALEPTAFSQLEALIAGDEGRGIARFLSGIVDGAPSASMDEAVRPERVDDPGAIPLEIDQADNTPERHQRLADFLRARNVAVLSLEAATPGTQVNMVQAGRESIRLDDGYRNVLTQQNLPQPPSSIEYALRLSQPARSLSFTRPELVAATRSGTSHPFWIVEALTTDGRRVEAREGLMRWFDPDRGVPAREVRLVSPDDSGIVSVRVISDGRLKGQYFAGHAGLLMYKLRILPISR